MNFVVRLFGVQAHTTGPKMSVKFESPRQFGPELAVAQPNKHEVLQAMRVYRGAFPAGFRFSRDEANAR